MTPHGSSTDSTSHIRGTRNPYEELAAPGLDPHAPAQPNPYEALAPTPEPGSEPGSEPGPEPGSEPGPEPVPASRRGAGYESGGPAAVGRAPGAPDDEPEGPAGEPEGPAGEPEGPAGEAGPAEQEYTDPMPYLRAVRRRRRSRLRRTVKAAVALVVLLAFLAVGDRWAVLYAENEAAGQIQKAAKLHAEPEVHIRGFPFLTQLAAEQLDHVDVAVPDMPAGRISVAQVSGSVEDVRIVSDGPTAIRGAVLGRVQGDVLLDFDDLDRELGTSQVRFTHGGGNDVLADGKLPVAGKEVRITARAHVRRVSDRGVATTVDRMRLDVPGLFSYTPGEDGGLRLARPVAERIRKDAAKARALFRVGAVAERFGLTPERAARVRQSEAELARVTGQPEFLDRIMRVNMLDVVVAHPELLRKIGVDPAIVAGLRKLEVPELADKLSLAVDLPRLPGDVRLRSVTVEEEGIRARLTGTGIPFGETAKR